MQGYKTTDQILHQLSQLIAKVNKAYLPHQPDDSHTNLYFDEVGQRITGRWFPEKGSRHLVVFDLLKWEYQILDENLKVVDSISQSGKTVAQSEDMVSKALKELVFSVEKLGGSLHFEIPKYPFLEEKIHKPKSIDLEKWIQIRSMANQANRLLLGYLQQEAEVRIWPHHFDTGVYVEVNSGLEIGFGLAMADSMIDTPYFYLSGYSLKNKTWNWEKAKELNAGRWIVTDNWKGAVLPITQTPIEKLQISDFIKSSLAWYITES